MTSVLKSSIVADNSDLVASAVRNAADVTKSTNSNVANIKEGYVGISPNDTHIKHLLDALTAGAGITLTETNDGGDESVTISGFSPPPLGRVDNDTLVVGTGAGDNQTLLDLATAGNWIGGASLESASELVHVYEVMATPDTYKLSDKQPQYSAPATANRIADMQVNQAGWVGTAGNGLNATSVVYDNGTTGDAVEVGNYAIIYDDASFTLGRGRGSGAGAAVGNLSVAKITATTAGAAAGTLTLEAGHHIAINDDDYIIVVDAGELLYRYDGSAWYRHIGAWFNDSGSNLLDVTAQYGSHQRYHGDSEILDEGADLTTASAVFVDVDASLSLEITTNGGDIMIGFYGTWRNDTIARVNFMDVELDGTRIGGDDGLVHMHQDVANQADVISFTHLAIGVPPGNHTIVLQWKTSGNNLKMFAGAGTASADLHPQFWAKEV
jgi:hypothetical protein